MGKQYSSLARVYDSLNGDFDYTSYARYLDKEIRDNEVVKSSLVLDLACGTGKITFAMRELGYDMTGVDLSEDMLAEAREICADRNITDILWLCQSMQEFELYGTVDACVCCLDSINYLTSYKDLYSCLSLVHNSLIPDGVFVFDINTPYKFENVYGDNAYILEDETAFCGWQNEYDPETGICDFYLSIFEEQKNGSYQRSDEHQQERCYTKETLCRLLSEAGFEVLGVYGDYDSSEPLADTERLYFAARARK